MDRTPVPNTPHTDGLSRRFAASSFGTPAGPLSSRGDLGFRGAELESPAGIGLATGGPAGGANPSGGARIYGTLVSVDEVCRLFQAFIEQFDRTSDLSRYMLRLGETLETGERSFVIDARDIHQFSQYLYSCLVNYPVELISFFDIVLYRIAVRLAGERDTPPTALQVKVVNLLETEKRSLRGLMPVDIEHLVSLSGIVIRCSELIPEMKIAHFQCTTLNCTHSTDVRLTRGLIQEPSVCPSCHKRFSYSLVHNASEFGNKQVVKLQESPDSIPPGETPQTVLLYCYDDLYDSVRPGDRVDVVGIYRAQGVRQSVMLRAESAVFKTFVDVISFNDKQGGAGPVEEELEGEELREYCEEILSRVGGEDAIVEGLVKSFAPSIWEHEDVKLGLLCQLVSGSGGAGVRANIHVLLIGDPSTAKSQLLQFVHHMAPRGVFTSGKGSSAVGLTAYVTKDPESKEVILESGALVLSDEGICCIDEFDKMDDNTRVILNEVMESQTVSIAKAGIIGTLNAKVGICACANPIGSKYDVRKSVVENINLPPGILSRFDLVYLILDRGGVDSDKRLAKHVVKLFGSDAGRAENAEPAAGFALVTLPELKKYIRYARSLNPEMSGEAREELIESYCRLRSTGSGSGGGYSKTVSATPRQLQSLIRLAESLAKLQLKSRVEVSHVRGAVRLIKDGMLSAATDPVTGKIDMDLLNTGMSESGREVRREVAVVIEEVLETMQSIGGFRLDVLRAKVLAKLKDDGKVDVDAGSGRDVGIVVDMLCREALRGRK